MDLRLSLLLCLLSLGSAVSEPSDVQADGPRQTTDPTCKFNEKELHTTVRSAALSALKGLCDPVEMEARLVAMEQRLSRKLEEMKLTLTRLLTDGVAYDYDEDDSTSAERHRYSSGAGSDGAELTHYGGFRAEDRRVAATGQRTSYKRYDAAGQGGSSRSASSQSSRSRSSSAAASTRSGAGAAANQLARDGDATYGSSRWDERRASSTAYRYGQAPSYGGAQTRQSGGSAADRTSSDSFQYAAYNASGHASGVRQVSSSSLGSRSGRGNVVRYQTSYTPSKAADVYSPYRAQHGRTAKSRRQRGRRQQARRRGQHVTDTISYVSSAESALRSRFWEVNTYNDTVYELDGKRMYSYYWDVKDFPTMMATWEDRHSLRSPSFYVYQGGYRMYIRVFPSRQGGNVYMHAGLTPGRFDDYLPWPFRLKLRLSLLDHSAVPHDIRSRIWDPRELCSGWNWRRPKGKDNYECVGLGFPQQLLETRRFILDGSVLIKLDVFLED